MKITVKQLIEKRACVEQVKVFRKLFGASATITLANCIKASKAGLDFNWAAQNLLPAPALKAYQKAIATAWEDYEKAEATAWEDYEKAIATAWEDYRKAKATVFYKVIRYGGRE